ncbi:MAG: hypothetical protein ACI9OJ_002969 [Myxococcota bacterium]|jgi:hypothetical protein
MDWCVQLTTQCWKLVCLALPLALCMPALADPVGSGAVDARPGERARDERSAPETEHTRRSVLSVIRGPAAFVGRNEMRPPTLTPTRASVHIELRPDLALVEQTFSVANAGKAFRATIGVRYTASEHTDIGLTTFKPLGASGWANGEALPANSVRITQDEDGYSIELTPRFVQGDTTVSLVVALQTVGERVLDSHSVPAAANPSRLVVLSDFAPGDWSTDVDTAPPQFATQLTTSRGVLQSSVRAERWTENALRRKSAFFWREIPQLLLTYDSDGAAHRASSWDELHREAKNLLLKQPLGHMDVPEDATRAARPGIAPAPPPIDPDRARRAMIVPGLGLIMLLLVGYLSQRRKEARA